MLGYLFTEQWRHCNMISTWQYLQNFWHWSVAHLGRFHSLFSRLREYISFSGKWRAADRDFYILCAVGNARQCMAMHGNACQCTTMHGNAGQFNLANSAMHRSEAVTIPGSFLTHFCEKWPKWIRDRSKWAKNGEFFATHVVSCRHE